jgi:hypothetical protein
MMRHHLLVRTEPLDRPDSCRARRYGQISLWCAAGSVLFFPAFLMGAAFGAVGLALSLSGPQPKPWALNLAGVAANLIGVPLLYFAIFAILFTTVGT